MSRPQRPSSAARVLKQRRAMVMRAAEEGMGNLVLFALAENTTGEELAQGPDPKSAPLVTACLNGHYEVAKNLLEKCNAPVNSHADVTIEGMDYKEVTPLWAASESGNLDLVRYLLQHGANVNQSTSTKSTPLRVATYNGYSQIVQLLIKHGADVNAVNRAGHSILMLTCQIGDKFVETAKVLLANGADVNYACTEKGETTLHKAACEGATDTIKLLLSHGAFICPNKNGETPLMQAAYKGQDSIVELLIESPDSSRDDKANALEVLGTFYWMENKVDECLQLWERAMKERHQPGKPVAEKRQSERQVPAYSNATEVQTPQALRRLKSSRDRFELGVQSMLIRERVLGKNNNETTLMIRYNAALNADENNFNQAIDLLHHLLENLTDVFPFALDKFEAYTLLVCVLITQAAESGVVFSRPLKALKCAVDDFQHGEASGKELDETMLTNRLCYLKTILQLIALLQEINDRASQKESSEFMEIVSHFVKRKPCGENGNSLLHMACQKNTHVYDPSDREVRVIKFPSANAVEALLNAGCDVKARNEAGQTALQVLQKEEGNHTDIVRRLTNAGCK